MIREIDKWAGAKNVLWNKQKINQKLFDNKETYKDIRNWGDTWTLKDTNNHLGALERAFGLRCGQGRHGIWRHQDKEIVGHLDFQDVRRTK